MRALPWRCGRGMWSFSPRVEGAKVSAPDQGEEEEIPF